jgi:hypothetical protein
MGAVDTTYTFTATDTITSSKMNNIIDQTTITGDAIFENTLEVVAGKLKVRAQGIRSNELATDAVTSTKITNGSVDPTKLSTGAPSWDETGLLSLGASGATASLIRNTGTSGSFDISNNGPISFNSVPLGIVTGSAPIYGARAWVSFNGTVAGVFAGGGSTVTRLVGQTLCTVTTAAPHGLSTNNRVYAATGVVTGVYIITKVTNNSFTFTTAATTALTSVSITFNTRSINGAGNINSISYAGTGVYYVNMSIPLESANYAVAHAGTSTGATGESYISGSFVSNKNTSSFVAEFTGASTSTNANQSIVDFVVFQ